MHWWNEFRRPSTQLVVHRRTEDLADNDPAEGLSDASDLAAAGPGVED
jgi:hypothetical protein